MPDETLITEEQFIARVRQWANRERGRAKANAAAFAKGKKAPRTYIKGMYAGKTEYKLRDKTTYKLKTKNGDLDHVAFQFPVHGIFREYGVGNGQPRRGAATKSGRKASQRVYVRRSMSDWISKPIDDGMAELSKLVAERYGDKALAVARNLLK